MVASLGEGVTGSLGESVTAALDFGLRVDAEERNVAGARIDTVERWT